MQLVPGAKEVEDHCSLNDPSSLLLFHPSCCSALVPMWGRNHLCYPPDGCGKGGYPDLVAGTLQELKIVMMRWHTLLGSRERGSQACWGSNFEGNFMKTENYKCIDFWPSNATSAIFFSILTSTKWPLDKVILCRIVCRSERLGPSIFL